LENNLRLLYDFVVSAACRFTASDLIQQASHQWGWSQRQVRALLRQLIEAGRLAFSPEGSGSFVELAFAGCVAVGRRLALCPPGFIPDPGRLAVQLHQGAAFGCGRHPSTRLALQAIEALFDDPDWNPASPRVLDIGTGSGVLAIAALRLGAVAAKATDIDPVALAEAKANLALNGYADKAVVDASCLDQIDPFFDLITANLRYPTLCRMAPQISRLITPCGRLVLAGLRPEEAMDILATYRDQAMACLWQETEQGWMALGMGKTGSSHPMDGAPAVFKPGS